MRVGGKFCKTAHSLAAEGLGVSLWVEEILTKHFIFVEGRNLLNL